MTRRSILQEGTALGHGGYTVSVAGLSEDKDAGEPCVANRGQVVFSITGPDGTQMVIRLDGAEAEHLVRPLVLGAVLTESEGDIARRYLRDHAFGMSAERIASLRERAGYTDE
ncbi:MAG TPA: hypothetical protein VF867_13280 [Arthrobacter sp.]